jgi:hypothetical protein
VIARGDALNVFYLLERGGSTAEHLQRICLLIFWLCRSFYIDLTPDWVPRDQNQLANYLSKFKDLDDFGLQPSAFQQIVEQFGKLDIDRFASEYNALLPVFYSEVWTPMSSGANAFTFDWSGSRSFCFPPPRLVPRVLEHARECATLIVLVVLDWPGQHWWPLLVADSGRGWAPFMRRSLRFPAGPATFRPGRGSAEAFFGQGYPTCAAFVLTSPSLAKCLNIFLPLPTEVFLHGDWDPEAAGLPRDDPEICRLLFDF